MVVANTPHIFVSHSHEDNDFGIQLVTDLRHALGGDVDAVWYDAHGGLQIGDEWWQKIVREITERPIFLVVLSPNSMASKWVNDEITIAWQQKNSSEGKKIVPIEYQPCNVRGDIAAIQRISFLSDPYPVAFARLLDALGIGTPAPAPVVAPTNVSSGLVEQVLPQLRAAFAAGDWADVERKADLLIRRAPENATAEVYRLRGLALLEDGQPGPARGALETALRLNPNDVQTLRAAVRATSAAGAPAEAETLLVDALALASDAMLRFELLGDYAVVLSAEGKWERVLRSVDEALRLQPEALGPQITRLHALGQLGRGQEALLVARQLTTRPDATPSLWLERAWLAKIQKQSDEARQCLDVAARLVPYDAEIQQARAAMFPAPQIPPERFPPRLAELGYVATFRNNVEVITPPMCDVPGGSCLVECGEHEHWVTLESFEIARYAVTVAEYAAYLRATGKQPDALGVAWSNQSSRLDAPVIGMARGRCKDYADWLSQVTGQAWSVPSEEEWERAAYWDESSRRLNQYPWGAAFDVSRAGKYPVSPAIAMYPTGASPCGAQDMVNNIWEWVDKSWQATETRRPKGSYSSTSDRKCVVTYSVLRGGSPAQYQSQETPHRRLAAEIACNQRDLADSSKHAPMNCVGFRLVRRPGAAPMPGQAAAGPGTGAVPPSR